ncbi:MAG: flagellar basal body L-ring protein FlgH [Pseudomonadota bacterium]
MTMKTNFACLAITASVLSGCMSGGQPTPGFAGPPPPSPPIQQIQTSPEASKGAIFQVTNGYAGLHVGTRARSIGDMVTILLVESTSTSKSTSGATNREGGLSLTPPIAGPLDFLNPDALKAAGEASFTGQGNAAQRSQLNGAVAVTIAAIYPNGTAEVVGEKHMSLSQGKEWVQFAGRIRLIDISAENTLPSSRVANARIIYSGNGVVQQASKPGWLSRFFNFITPF